MSYNLEKLLDSDSDSEVEIDSDLDYEIDVSEDEDHVSDDDYDSEASEEVEWTTQSDSDSDEIVYTSKSGFEWSSVPPQSTSSFPSQYRTGLTNGSKNINSIKDAFSLFLSADIIEEVCDCTNLFLSNKGKVGDITFDEVLAFIGVLLSAGAVCEKKTIFQRYVDYR